MRYIIFCMLLIASGCYSSAHPEWRVSLVPKGEIYLVHRGFWKNEEHLIKKINNEWYWNSPNGYEKLVVPYESPFNESGAMLVLDKGGEIFVIDKDHTRRDNLKVIDGEWNRHGDDGWYEIFGDI